ncbi:UDP-2,4-diacetamido-2,4,6-trideoxy-beta-L-altropyranose hydrolase [Arenicella xantha]|uniref:UDP-2,4-diacetamido-2,4, 6-trideoxy-beta-L-altropyranose hydrolase n=1 Tax=Arenicella xantha TaxID=644221 RepID=A0A395JID5_9GAMM|nr:UDP-2,4-diacetamido-2,4,6-trideoxy-beta-L-altropyranose hydrolase [Arenicella xantha]RBP49887.1 UDP-2,4-diacetamido-2,4,6-trideoxy-beta-L-altropyranose hydrolase [Arenicella xantha]
MQVAIRADASVDTGIGHIMRTLVLANELDRRGADISFFCRRIPCYLADKIRKEGHQVFMLGGGSDANIDAVSLLEFPWLGVSQEQDALDFESKLDQASWDWLIVDHYGLDRSWESLVDNCFQRSLVIDDLANRNHQCDFLLDQTYAREPAMYAHLVQPDTVIFVGANYALLRDEFRAMRDKSLRSRGCRDLQRILIMMGGTDPGNIAGLVLANLAKIKDCKFEFVQLVVGSQSPKLADLKMQLPSLPFETELLIDTDNVADLLYRADLVIGAAGSSAWERCCLGVPSLIVEVAENQKQIALSLHSVGAAFNMGSIDDENFSIKMIEKCSELFHDPAMLKAMSDKAAEITRGDGAKQIANAMMRYSTI